MIDKLQEDSLTKYAGYEGTISKYCVRIMVSDLYRARSA
jgi:hypothetical protein